jgi:CheY-like chemotaxis protein
MGSRSIAVPRNMVFTLEDGTWVVQWNIDRVQELLTTKERSFSSLDISYDISDMELDLLLVQGLIEQYDDFFVWLPDQFAEPALAGHQLGLTTYYYVKTTLDVNQMGAVRQKLENSGLSDRYEVAERFGKVAILSRYEEPFIRLSLAEDAQTLLAPVVHDLSAKLSVEAIQFNTSALQLKEHVTEGKIRPKPDQPLIRNFAPLNKSRTIVCIDKDKGSHALIREVCADLGAEIASAYNARDGMTLIQDADPALILMDLTLSDSHGYEIVAFIRNNPELAHIPIIIISALDTDTDRVFAFSIAKVKDYVVKPLKSNDLRRRVWRVLNNTL